MPIIYYELLLYRRIPLGILWYSDRGQQEGYEFRYCRQVPFIAQCSFMRSRKAILNKQYIHNKRSMTITWPFYYKLNYINLETIPELCFRKLSNSVLLKFYIMLKKYVFHFAIYCVHNLGYTIKQCSVIYSEYVPQTKGSKRRRLTRLRTLTRLKCLSCWKFTFTQILEEYL